MGDEEKQIGLRKGKRKAIHTLGILELAKNKNEYAIKKIYSSERFCKISSKKSIREGLCYIAIFPKPEEAKKEENLFFLKKLSEEKTKLKAEFESKSREEKIEISFDNRGRAKNLEEGKGYFFELLTKAEFFKRYEIGSIPSGRKGLGKGKAEPSMLGEERIINFNELAGLKGNELVLDAAAGIKEYLKSFSLKKSKIFCLNISHSILARTREWLDYAYANFIAYNADSGVPFKKEAFDVAICDAVLEYIEKPEEFLGMLAFCMKKNGKLLVLEPVERHGKNMQDFYPQDMFEVALWRPLYDKDFKRENFEKVLKNLGFVLESRKTMEFSYELFENENFSQSVGRFRKVFI